jgi:hypothetical protein
MDLVSFFLFLFSCCYDAALAFASVLGAYSSLVGLEGLGHWSKVANCETWCFFLLSNIIVMLQLNGLF